MAGPGIAVRCPSCGTDLRAYPAPSPPTQWFPCPHCRRAVPVAVPRDPPPLYTWEILPGLYPPLDRPRAPRWRLRPAAAIALAVAACAAAILGGALFVYGHDAGGAGAWVISGIVVKDVGGVGYPADGARVTMTDASGGATLTTGPDGRFAFTDVPTGAVSVNASLPSGSGYAPSNLSTFVSPVYDAGSTGLTIVLYPGGPANGTSTALAAFGSLTGFLASIYGAAGLLALIAIVGAVAAWATVRPSLRTAPVIGGGAAVGSPAVVYLLGLAPAFPWVAAAGGIAAGLGLFAIAVGAVDLARDGGPVGAA